jgi:hypothetical protein
MEELKAHNRFEVPLPQLDFIHFPSLLGEGARRADEAKERASPDVSGEVEGEVNVA